MAKERLRLRIGNMGKAVLITGQVYQEPKDALNEFVSNAADEYAGSPPRRADPHRAAAARSASSDRRGGLGPRDGC